MRAKINQSIIIFICIISLNFINVNSKIISEGYHFFDIFYYRDLYNYLINQKKDNKCSIDDGPSCYYIKGKDEELIYKELNKLYPDKKSFLKESPENILSKIKETTTLIQGKDTKTLEDEVYSFDTPYTVSLYLTFESYDEKTKYNDIYAPEIIDNQYEAGRLTLTISGKLRLTQKNAEKYESKILASLREEGPKKTYAYVESKEVIFQFSSESSISSLYIKKNKYNTNNKKFYLYGYKNGHRYIITKMENVPSDRWIKVNGNIEKYNSIGLIRGFDYDNFVINAIASKSDMLSLSQFTKKYADAFNERINEMITKIISGLKNDGNQSGDNGGIKIVRVNLNQNEVEQENGEDFEIPEEIMNEINKNERDKNNKDKTTENINKRDL